MDSSILLTTNALLSSASAIVMLVVLRTRKTYPGFAFWTAGVACLALGAAMLVPGALPGAWIVRVGRNAALVAGYALVLRGMLVFRGYRVGYWLEGALAAAFLAVFGWFSLDPAALDARIVTYCAFVAGLGLATVVVILRRRPAHFGSNDVMLAFCLATVVVLSVVRALHQVSGPDVTTAFEALKGFGTLYAVAQIFTVQLVTLTLVSMNSQRIEWEYRTGEARLRESEERLRSVGDNLPDGFVFQYELVDGKPRFRYVSRGVEAILGLKPEDLLADPRLMFALLAPDVRQRYAEDAARSARDGSPYRGTLRFDLPGGRALWMDLRSGPQRRPDGGTVWNGVAIDVTDRLHAEEDQRRFQAIVDFSDDAIIGKTLRGVVTSWNRGAERIFGYRAEEMVGHSIDRIIPESLAGEEREIVARVARGEHVDHFDTVRRHRSGRLVDVSVSISPIVDTAGAIAGAAKIARDISGRKQAEREIGKLTMALEQSPESIVITDVAALIEYVNEACVQATGYSREELIGTNPRLLKSGRTPRSTYDEMWATLAEGRHWKGEFANRRKDGTPFDEYAVIAPIRQPDGKVTHYLAVKEDITEKKRMTGELAAYREHLEDLVDSRTRELAEASRRAEEANVAKSAFLANMSHEIRTPLNAMIGMAHLVRRGGLTDEQAGRLGKLEAAAAHLLEILNAVLDLSKIDAGKFVLEEIPLRVESAVANVVSMLDDRAAAKGLRLASEVDRMPRDLVGDPTRLQQALLNYATNAVKFTASGGVTIRARLVSQDDASAVVRFEVEDSGQGIPADVIPRLFSAFEQADNSTTRKSGGTGLGLAITRKLAELMGGKAGVRSTPGVGSTFWFTARLRKAAQPAAEAAAPAEGAAEALRQRHAGNLILVAEDNDINAEVAKAILEDVGLAVDIAADGVEAVAKAAAKDYRLVLMDMQMPRMDGLDATREIRKRLPASRLPIVAMTANAFADDKRRCQEAGMDDFVSKPVDPDTLYACLLAWLDREPGD